MLLPKVAKIAVEQTAYHYDKLYSYTVPQALEPLRPGCRVLVPFGGGNRKRQGIVIQCDAAADYSRLKPISAVLDKEPLLSQEMLELALWLKERTFCTVFDAVHAMLPSGLYLRVKPTFRAAELTPDLREALSREECAAVEYVASCKGGVDRDRFLAKMGLSADNDLPERLVRIGALIRCDDAFRRMGDATVRMARLRLEDEELADALSGRGCTEKQKKVVSLLREAGCASVKEICYFSAVTPAVVQALEKKGIIELFDNEVLRKPYASAPDTPPIASAALNVEQQAAFDSLYAQYQSGKPSAALLYGVTGSGKTQVYMNLIDRVIADGRHVLVLVPEISLTPQMMALFLGRYGRRVAVLHSGLSIGERMDEWKRIKRGQAQITVGTRSAVFAPCGDLGLIVMDEEQEHTYKSEASPRYHARDVARFRCAKHKAMLLLTSATPSVETFHAAKSGRYSLEILRSRYGDAQLPSVEVVDMRQEPEGEGGIISERLRLEIAQTLQEGRQAILLLNRRGFNTFVSCRSCGHVVTCPSCSISLTYHRANGRLMCHYCGHSQEPVAVCPQCGSDKMRYTGLGTQRAEEELTRLFPGVSILRMDTDTTMSRYAYEKKFRDFSQGKYSLMIGTQMVAKGLDFPNVGLVGVLSADQSLYGDDYRCFETTFALLTQVVGRAGRRELAGKAIIQTYTPDNYVIELAAKQDYEGFYEAEIAARRMMKYPPYTDLCMFGFVGAEEQAVKQAAFRFLSLLREEATGEFHDVPMIALDPSPAMVSRVAGKYRYKLLVKTVNTARMRQMTAGLLGQFSRASENKTVTVYVDVNPAVML